MDEQLKQKKKIGIYQKFFKRFLDITLSLLALIILSPIFLIVSILSLIFIGHPVILKQYRPGKNGKLFKLYKFRSMTNKKDKNGNLLPDKDRLTTYGKIIRKLSLDEIPQLINILKGDMSIVGPRPRLVKDMIFYEDEILKQAYNVRPGLTGPAQVFDRHSELSWDKVFKNDLDYAQNITFWGDVKMVFKTVFAVFSKEKGTGKKREYYYPDHLLKAGEITKDQYNRGLKKADEIIKENGKVEYQQQLHKKDKSKE